MRLIRIICTESEYNITTGLDHEGISSHWHFGKGLVTIIEACILFGADNGLKSMAVEMKRVSAGIIVIEHNLDNFIAAEDEGVC